MYGQVEEVKLTGKQSKTYNIGERCCYGTVKVTVHKNQVLRVALLDYKTTNEREVQIFDKNERNKFMSFLEDNMDYYFAEKILNDFYEQSN